MPTIRVNGNDGCFESIVRLYSGGFIPSHMIDSATADSIKIHGGTEFIKDDGSSFSSSENTFHINGTTGATWFSAIRGEPADTDSAEWQNFIEGVRNYFHERYSWLEYSSTESEPDERTKRADTAMLSTIIEKFWEWGVHADIKAAPATGTMHVFGAGLRLAMNNGVGEPRSVIGHIYFSRGSDGTLSPIPSAVAEDIHASMQFFESADETKISDEANDRKTVDDLLFALEGLFERNDTASPDADGLEDWLYIASETDREAMDSLTEQGHGREGAIPLICSLADLLNIFHISRSTRLYSIEYRGQPLLEAEFVLGNSVTVRCKACKGERPIIESNRVRAASGKTLIIDPTKPDLGLSEKDINLLREEVFSAHLREITHRYRSPVKDGEYVTCSRMKCSSGIFSVGEEGSENVFCLDCPHKEILYPMGDKLIPIKTLAYDASTLALIPATNEDGRQTTGSCRFCHRSFEGMRNNTVCPFCDGKSDQDMAEKLYKKYSPALPLHTRLANLFSKKACYEDSEYILFIFTGKEEEKRTRYYLSKYRKNGSGLSASPRKVK